VRIVVSEGKRPIRRPRQISGCLLTYPMDKLTSLQLVKKFLTFCGT